MLNLPIVKFEKSCNYLNEQLTLQNNNKQLILDIISNIGLILNNSEENFEQYDSILESANEFLKIISSNITSIEQLYVEIKNITAELTNLLSEQNKTSKTKEFYIAAFSNIKHNIIVYSKKFQELENILTIDNNKFNEFINENNFKYNFVSIDDSTNSYTFTGFSINDSEEISNEVVENTCTDNTDSVVETVVKNSDESDTNTENIELTATSETENIELDNNNVTETTITESPNNIVENSENVDTEDNIVENSENIDAENNIIENSEISPTKNISKIDELTNEFKSLLLNISETNLSDATSSVVSLFKELLPKESSATFEDFLDLGNQTEEVSEEENNMADDETIENGNKLENFNPEEIVDNYIIKELESIILETHSGLIYEYDEDLDTFVSYEKEIIEDKEIVTSAIVPEKTNTTVEASFIEPVLENSVLVENSSAESSDLLLDNTLVESTEELFTEDLSDIEEIENNNDDSSFLLSEISFNDILDNIEINLEEEIVENTLNEENNIEEEINQELSDEDLVIENSIDNNIDFENTIIDDENIVIDNEVSLSALDLLDDITLLDNFDNSILDDVNLIENEKVEDNNFSEIALDENETLEPEIVTNNEKDNTLDEALDNVEKQTDIEKTDEIIEPNTTESNVTTPIDSTLESNDIVESDQENLSNVEHFYKEDIQKNAVFKNKGMSKKDFNNKLLKIENAVEDNRTLVISERLQKIYLPYKVSELENYVESYPDSYSSLKDVVNQEFILPFDYFRKHPSKARFTEAYNLLKNREGRNFIKSVSYAFRLLNKNNLNPAIIASCKTQHELDSYLYYLDSDNLNNFKFFDIIYEVNPI